MSNRILWLAFALALAFPASLSADGNINLDVPVNGSSTFNIGSTVTSVSVAEVIFTVDCEDSVFDCGTGTAYAAPILFVGFDDEDLPSSPPMLQYVGEPEDGYMVLPMMVMGDDAWDILSDGIARLQADVYITTEFPECTPTSIGYMNFVDDKVTVHLVYTSITGAEEHVWSEIKARYR